MTLRLTEQGPHYPDSSPDKGSTKNEKYRWIFPMNLDANVLNNILAHWIQQYIKKDYTA